MSDTPESPRPPVAAPKQPVKKVKPALQMALDGNSEPLRIFSHSAIIYWWPVWFLGLAFWLIGLTGLGDGPDAERSMGLTYVFTLVFVIFSTTVRLRGANSVIFGLVLVIGVILTSTAKLSGPIGDFVLSLDVRMSETFYLVMGVSVLALWSMMIFGFDRVKYWDIVPGQLHERVFWGSGDRSENGANAKCRYRSDDFLRHRILGLMMVGDLEITLGDGRIWQLHNVLFAKRRSNRVNQLIVMRPID
ncbi:hypothetical protein [Hyphomonas johnsonii]|uniref:Uncharacterized protein n=1 Tax=Hyphomonas johnsonii MHS-2 TaxID=1280950 RepID=A0A059FFX8_9PROT|nr:hypothetical protein [Hyphomonas johnsonii]KCZ89512.1 hypothetical protein HJO_14877 [Hyphomonas johnsonii MHS-2]